MMHDEILRLHPDFPEHYQNDPLFRAAVDTSVQAGDSVMVTLVTALAYMTKAKRDYEAAVVKLTETRPAEAAVTLAAEAWEDAPQYVGDESDALSVAVRALRAARRDREQVTELKLVFDPSIPDNKRKEAMQAIDKSVSTQKCLNAAVIMSTAIDDLGAALYGIRYRGRSPYAKESGEALSALVQAKNDFDKEIIMLSQIK